MILCSSPEHEYEPRRNRQPLSQRAETDPKKRGHRGSVSPSVSNPRVVPFAPCGVGESREDEYNSRKAPVSGKPKAGAEPQGCPPKGTEENQDIAKRAMNARPNDIGQTAGMVEVKH